MSGQDFEDNVIDALEEMVGDNGVVMVRKQSFSVRRGKFQAAQEVDILVDSDQDEFYLGVEAKSRDITTDNGSGLYFSSDYEPEQFNKQVEFRDRSGRRVGVAVELINHCEDEESCAYLCPLELFTEQHAEERKKATWEQIAATGVFIGHGDDVEIKPQDWHEMEERAEEILDDVDIIDQAVGDAEDHDAWHVGS